MRWHDLLSPSVLLPAVMGLAALVLSLRTASHPRGESRWWLVVFAVLTLLGAINGARDVAQNRELHQRLMLSTTFHCRIPQARAPRAHIAAGDANVTLDPRQQTLSMWPFEISMSPEQALIINGELRDQEQQIVAEIRDSTVMLRAPSYDCNSDLRALEIVDSVQRPVFRLLRDDSASQRGSEPFQGFLRMTYQTYLSAKSAKVCTEKECTVGQPSVVLRQTDNWLPLFQYPSYEKPGMRAIPPGAE